MRKSFRALLLLVLVALSGLILPVTANASGKVVRPLDYGIFSSLPVLHEGRVKPLGIFARIYLKRFSGNYDLKGMNAHEWLAEALFDPASSMERDVFRVRDSMLKTQLGLPADESLFSLTELQPGLSRTESLFLKLSDSDRNGFTAAERALVDLHDNVMAYVQIMRSLSMLLPLDIEIPDEYRSLLPADVQTFDLLSGLQEKVDGDVKKILAKKGQNFQSYSREEQDIVLFGFRLQALAQNKGRDQILRVIPVQVAGKESKEEEKGASWQWVSPWDLSDNSQIEHASTAYLFIWGEMADAYRNRDAGQWAYVMGKLRYKLGHEASGAYDSGRLTLEIIYNKVQPYTLALVLYGLSILMALGVATGIKPKFFNIRTCLAAGIAGAIVHAGAIVTRIIILGRPPVATLYESLLFASLVCVCAGIALSWRSSRPGALAAGAFAAGIALLCAPYLLGDKGESMEMLVAVLNTNFWLGTHVVMITAGYGICILCACLAHGYLFLRSAGRGEVDLQPLFANIHYISLIALFLTATGTALGGIWADQSWGRFWGWDPKENGALLIVLWLIWAHHGRLGGRLGAVWFTALLALLNVVVVLAWFGVNLLGVGLHSYGFISGIAFAVAGFCLTEVAAVGGLVYLSRRRNSGRVYGA